MRPLCHPPLIVPKAGLALGCDTLTLLCLKAFGRERLTSAPAQLCPPPPGPLGQHGLLGTAGPSPGWAWAWLPEPAFIPNLEGGCCRPGAEYGWVRSYPQAPIYFAIGSGFLTWPHAGRSLLRGCRRAAGWVAGVEKPATLARRRSRPLPTPFSCHCSPTQLGTLPAHPPRSWTCT